MHEIEAVGDAVAGGAIARSVEPGAGEAEDGHTHESACLNCGAALAGPYCHACGQQAHVHRTLSAFFHDFLHGVLHFEGKIWRTLPLLVWKPGELTRRYIDGQRARYVSPIALFLFSVFLMFAVLSASGIGKPDFSTQRDLAAAQRERVAKLAHLEKARSVSTLSASERAEIDDQIGDARRELALIRSLNEKGITQAELPAARATFSTKAAFIEEAYQKAKQNPDLLLYKAKSNSYKWSWAIIPLSVPFLWLLFPFSRRFRLYDHTVFITYSVAFMTLLVTAATLVDAIGIGAAVPAALLIPPVHMYRQLRGTYAITRFGALWRTILLAMMAVAILGTFALLMVALGLLD
jgi:hypothetical protein